jgi:hypothetical protein
MMSHLEQAHSDVCMYYRGIIFFVIDDLLQFSDVTPSTKHCKLMFAYGDVFCSRSEIKNGVFYYVLQYIGPDAEAAKYRYKLQFFNEDRTESLAVTLLARSWDEDLSEDHNSGNCVKLYPEQLYHFANEKSELAFSVKIVRLS